jgi:6-phosphofructokinase
VRNRLSVRARATERARASERERPLTRAPPPPPLRRPQSAVLDAGGNRKLPELGLWLKEQIVAYFQKQGKPATVKYIDPSYMIRSVPANASDSIYCELLAQNVVHGAMVRGWLAGDLTDRLTD